MQFLRLEVMSLYTKTESRKLLKRAKVERIISIGIFFISAVISLVYKFIQYYPGPHNNGEHENKYQDPGCEPGLNRSLNVFYRVIFVLSEINLGVRLLREATFFISKKVKAIRRKKQTLG